MTTLLVLGKADLRNEHGEVIATSQSGKTAYTRIPMHEHMFSYNGLIGYNNARGDKLAVDTTNSIDYVIITGE